MLREAGTGWALLVLGPSQHCSSLTRAWLLLGAYRTGFILKQRWDGQLSKGVAELWCDSRDTSPVC